MFTAVPSMSHEVLEPVVGELGGVLELVRRGDLEELERRVGGPELGGGEVVVDDAVGRDGQDVDGVRCSGRRSCSSRRRRWGRGRPRRRPACRRGRGSLTCRLGAAPGSRGRRSPASRRPPRPSADEGDPGRERSPGCRRRRRVRRTSSRPSGRRGGRRTATASTAVGLQPLPVSGGTPPASGRARIPRATARSAPVSCRIRTARSRRMSVASRGPARSTSPNSRLTLPSWKRLCARSRAYSASVSSPLSRASVSASSGAGARAGSSRSSDCACAAPARTRAVTSTPKAPASRISGSVAAS